jgi:hypothetical protein
MQWSAEKCSTTLELGKYTYANGMFDDVKLKVIGVEGFSVYRNVKAAISCVDCEPSITFDGDFFSDSTLPDQTINSDNNGNNNDDGGSNFALGSTKKSWIVVSRLGIQISKDNSPRLPSRRVGGVEITPIDELISLIEFMKRGISVITAVQDVTRGFGHVLEAIARVVMAMDAFIAKWHSTSMWVKKLKAVTSTGKVNQDREDAVMRLENLRRNYNEISDQIAKMMAWAWNRQQQLRQAYRKKYDELLEDLPPELKLNMINKAAEYRSMPSDMITGRPDAAFILSIRVAMEMLEEADSIGMEARRLFSRSVSCKYAGKAAAWLLSIDGC